MKVVEIDPAVTCIELTGRMDAPGCEKIETSFTAATSAASTHIVVDLTKVEFIGSLGIRLLISNGRVVHRRNRKLVIFGAQQQPLDVFETVALGDLIPIVPDKAAALALLVAG